MQTFLPYKDFAETAYCLDSKRLGKQRVETLQIIRALTGKSKGWVNHPAVKMWRGYEYALMMYGLAICAEWGLRGYKDTCADKMLAIVPLYTETIYEMGYEYPDWLGDERLHASHRSNLLRKDTRYYSKFHWKEPNDLPYIWPVK